MWCEATKDEFRQHLSQVPANLLRSSRRIKRHARAFEQWSANATALARAPAPPAPQRIFLHKRPRLSVHTYTADDCKSIQNHPLQCVDLADYSPAPMHVFLGIVNDVLHYEWIPCLGEQRVQDCLIRHRVYFERYHAHSLSGNGVKLLLNSFPAILNDLAPHAPPNFQIHYSSFFRNLFDMYRLSMRVDNLTLLDINHFALLCQRYVIYRQACLQLMHGDPWHRSLTPKEHTLLAHFQPFLSTHHSLGRFSEQAHEAVHHEFNTIAEEFKSAHDLIDKLPFIIRSLNERNLYKLNPNV